MSDQVRLLSESDLEALRLLAELHSGPSFGYVHELCEGVRDLIATVKALRSQVERGALCEECEQWEYNEDGSCRTFTVCGACWNKAQETVKALRADKARHEAMERDFVSTCERIAASIGMQFCCLAETMELESRVAGLQSQLEQLRAERDRLLRGEFTDDELQGFCHNLSEQDRDAFFEGCTRYQQRLFGTSVAEKVREEIR